MLLWRYMKPLEDDTLIKEYEEFKNYKFSELFIKYAKEFNGGRPNKELFDTDKTRGRVIKKLLSFRPNDKENVWNCPSDIGIPFAMDHYGNYIAFEKDSEKVIFVDHETDQIEFVANNFKEFILKLR